jgi:mono/diheme cytochrome c family protein
VGDERAPEARVRAAIVTALFALILAGCANESHASAAAGASAAARNPGSAYDGEAVYANNCSSCHQADGKGVAGAFPPLASNPVVGGDAAAVIAIVKNGQRGRVVAVGRSYDGVMPAWGGLLTDEQIADVVTYVRSSWKNRASGVSIADVAAVKARAVR